MQQEATSCPALDILSLPTESRKMRTYAARLARTELVIMATDFQKLSCGTGAWPAGMPLHGKAGELYST